MKNIFGKLIEVELIFLKLLGYKFQYSNGKLDRLMKFWIMLCIFSHFSIPVFAFYNLAVNGFSQDFISESFLLTHSIGAGSKLIVFVRQRNILEKLLDDVKILHEKGDNIFNIMILLY
jgi:hypothetical protein